MKGALSQYRLRKAAIELKSFTVNELTTATGMNRESVQVFLHRLEKRGAGALTKESLALREPGRPIVRYTLTAGGLEILKSENAPIEQELNESAQGEISPTISATPTFAVTPSESQRFAVNRVGD